MTTSPEDALTMDIRRDLERVDGVMTQVISDSTISAEFIRDPSGVLARLGLHPPASREVHDRVNRIFYAVLCNVELINLIVDRYTSTTFNTSFAAQLEGNARVFSEGLSRGVLQNSIELDLVAADYVFRQPDFMRQVYRLTLYDLNNRRLLQNVYSIEQLDDYIEKMIESIQERRPIREHPKLEVWEPPHYGIGTGYAVGEVEVGPAATAVAAVEVFAAVTVFLPVGVFGASPTLNVMASKAVQGDPESVRMLATVGALINLAGEMLVYVNNFERR